MNQNDNDTVTPTTDELLAEIARLERVINRLHNDITLLHSTATEAIGKLSKIQEILK